MGHPSHLFSATKSKYLKFKSRLEKNISSGNFDSLSRRKKNHLISRVEKFRSRLEKMSLSMKGAAVAGSFAAGAIIPNAAMAQGSTQGLYFQKTGSAIPFPATTTDFVLANIDSDPELEIILSTPSGGQILNGDIDNGFTSSSPVAFTYMEKDIFVGDLDGDNDLDIIFTADGDATEVRAAFNDGDGNFVTYSLPDGASNSRVDLVDWDSDGDLDVVMPSNGSYFDVSENDGDGNFTDYGTIDLNQNAAWDLEFADLDNDGDMDLVHVGYLTTIPYTASINALENTTDGPGVPTFDTNNPVKVREINYIGRFDGIEVLDMDGDGDLDIFWHIYNFATGFASQNQHIEGTTFGFSDITVSAAPPSASAINDAAVADFDNDGDDDLILARAGAGVYNEILRFNGTSLSSTSGNLNSDVGNVASTLTRISLGDLDQDGNLDLVGINSGNDYAYLDVSGPQRIVIAPDDFTERRAVANGDLGALIAFDRNGNDIADTDGGTVFTLATGNGTNDADNARFTISGSGSTARLLVGGTDLDFETQSTYRILINGLASGVNREFAFELHLKDSPEAGDGTFDGTSASVSNSLAITPVLADIDGDGDDELIFKDDTGYSDILVQNDLSAESGTVVASGGVFTATDFDKDGDIDLLVGEGYDLSIYTNDGNGNFSYAFGNTVTGYIYDIATADIDGDGDNDIILATYGGGYVEYNDDNQGFGSRNPILYGIMHHVEVGDFDGDGFTDVVLNSYDDTYVYSNDGGSLSLSGSYNFNNTRDLKVANFDGDGDLDLLIVSDYSLNLLDGQGDGSFVTYATSIPYTHYRSDLAVGDIDGDTDLDVVFASGDIPRSGSYDGNRARTMINDGSNNFNESQDLPVSQNTTDTFGGLVLGDVDGDDDLDLLVSGGTERQVMENRNIAPYISGFSGSTIVDENTPSGTFLGQLLVADLNTDPITSIGFSAGANDNDFFLLDASGNLTLNTELDWEQLGSDLFVDIELIDDQANARVETKIIKINNLIEKGNGLFDDDPIPLFGTQTTGFFEPGDYDMDGDADLFRSASGGGVSRGISKGLVSESVGISVGLGSSFSNSIFQQNSGSFNEETIGTLSSPAVTAVFIDYDNDGDLDLLFADSYNGFLKVSTNGDGIFSSYQTIGIDHDGINEIIVGDFDGDGFQDAAIHVNNSGDYDYSGVRTYQIDENGAFTFNQYLQINNDGVGGGLVAGDFESMSIGDFDGDGFDDLLIITSNGDDVIFPGSGSGFSTTYTAVVTQNDYGFGDGIIGDVNGDGSADLLIARNNATGSNLLDVYLNNGSAAFTLNQSISGVGTVTNIEDIKLGDIDGDGSLDLISATYEYYGPGSNSRNIEIRTNDGSGSFSLIQTIPGAAASDIKLMDVDGDDDSDIVLKRPLLGEDDDLKLFALKNVNVAPTAINLSSTSFDEHLPLDTEVATITIDDLNLNDTHVISLVTGDGSNDQHNSYFSLNSNSLRVSKDVRFEDTPQLFILLSAYDGHQTYEQAIVLNVNDVNLAPTAINLSTTSFDEGTAAGSTIATISAVDPNVGDSHAFQLATGDGTNDADNALFVIDGDKLIITEESHFETKPSYNIYLSATDIDNTIEQAFVLTVNDINQAPTGINLSATSFDEGTAPGTSVATISAIDANAGDTHIFELTTGDGSNDADNGLFVIDGDQLIITASSSFETKPSYSIYLSAADDEGSVEQAFVLTVNDINQAPTGINLSATSFDEGTAPGTSVATISAIDANAGDTHTFELTTGDGSNDTDNGLFVIDGDQLIITASSSFETKPSYSIYLSAADDEGSVEQAFVLTVNDINQAPTGINLSATSFDEGTAPGTSVATISAIDANAGDTHIFELTTGDGSNDADNGLFVIDGDQLIITAASSFETKPSYNVYLTAADDEGSVEQAFVLTVNDINQAPTGINLSAVSFDEGTAPSSLIATISATDANAGDTHTFELAAGDGTNDADNGLFVIDGDQLIITVASNFETKPSYNVYLSAADDEGSVEQAFVLTVNDINQAPTGINLSATSFDEGTNPGSSIATISAIDANAGDIHSFELATGDGANDADNGLFLINGDQLIITAASNFETKASYNVYLSAADKEGSVAQGFVLTVNDINQAPTAITLSNSALDEGTSPGTVIASISVTDPNAGDSHSLSLATGDGTNDAHNSMFVINGTDLILIGNVNFDNTEMLNILISANDGEESFEQAFVLTVNDVLGLEDELTNTLGIYPNPGGNKLKINFENDLRGKMSIKVSDLSGKIIHAYQSEKSSSRWREHLDMTNAKVGIYLVEIRIDNQQFTQRWIKRN